MAPNDNRTERDPSVAAARYRIGKDAPAEPERGPTADELRAIAKTTLDRAIDRGDFDNLPLAGKPLPGLGSGTYDPDWWVKALVEREGLSGVAPPALSLRTENEKLDDLLDTMASEASVRATVADFNARIVEARRQLAGGPPVVTPTREPDREVARWQSRRDARRAVAVAAAASEASPPPSWRERRRSAREARRRP
ncbi:MAG: hypothetical protein JWP75_1096 [Frondihabitans sp.]|nr:hypothetical protein [Frondihabitans sp.]